MPVSKLLCCLGLILAAPALGQPAPDPLIAPMLRVHNAARAEVRSTPLVWDAALAAEARGWARRMARDGRMRHSGRRGHGENLWAGTRSMFRPEQMARVWVDEKRFFINRPAVDFSTTGSWSDVGHYTQIIWSGTTRVSCALASGRHLDFLVCRYTAPGNVIGQRAIPER